MTRPGPFTRFAAWLALLSLVAASLWPAMSWAFSPGHGPADVAICSAGDSSETGSVPSRTIPNHAGHCTWCGIHCDAIPLPVTAAAVAMGLALADHRPPAVCRPPIAQAWPAGQPRAPPAPEAR